MQAIRIFFRTACFVTLVSVVACTKQSAGPEVAELQDDERPDIVATNAFYYYNDVDAAWTFYRDTLGLETVVDYGFAKILRLAEASYLTVVQADAGMHSADEPKIVTLHLVTDELNRWHEYLAQQGKSIQLDDSADDISAANGFSIRDPEGYLLHFVRYNPHPAHAGHVAAFSRADPVQSNVSDVGEMRIRATMFSVFYSGVEQARTFFESLFAVESSSEMLGVPIYQMSDSGFVALEEYQGPALTSPGENGMTLSFLTSDVDAWFARASSWPGFELRTDEVLNEGDLVRVFVGYDPAGIFLEWDTFLEVPENRALLDYLP